MIVQSRSAYRLFSLLQFVVGCSRVSTIWVYHVAGAVERRGFVPPESKVYCSFYFYGSPAEK